MKVKILVSAGRLFKYRKAVSIAKLSAGKVLQNVHIFV